MLSCPCCGCRTLHPVIAARQRELGGAHGMGMSAGQVELLSRLVKDSTFYRRWPLHAAWWLLRCSTPSTWRRWSELRTGLIHFPGQLSSWARVPLWSTV